MNECGVCYETRQQRFFPCNHSVCHSCYDQLIGDNCPFCRTPFRQSAPPVTSTTSVYADPEYWLDYDRDRWTVMSRFLRTGTEVIRVFRNNQVPASWRNDSMTTVVKRRRRLRGRLRR